MAGMKIKLDHPGIASILKSGEVAGIIGGLASAVAGSAGGHTTASGESIPVVVSTYTTDRAAAAVTLAHPAGMAVEAKYGLLSKGAAAAGLEVGSGSDNDLVDYVKKDGTKRKATRAQARAWSGGKQG